MAEDLPGVPEPIPAAPPARTAARKPPVGVTRSLAKLEADLGGRAALVAALSHAPKSRDLDYVLGLIGDPSFKACSLAEICAMGGITAGELIDGYQAGLLRRSHAISMKRIAEELPDVVADTFRLAKPYEGTCHGCQGLGKVTPEPTKAVPSPEPTPCPLCGSSGVLTYQGDLDHKKLALELGRLTSKGGGINVQVDNRSAHLHGGGGEAAGGTLEQLQLATDRLLYGGGPGVGSLGTRGDLLLPSAAAAIDAELIEAEDGEEDLHGEAADNSGSDPESTPPAVP